MSETQAELDELLAHSSVLKLQTYSESADEPLVRQSRLGVKGKLKKKLSPRNKGKNSKGKREDTGTPDWTKKLPKVSKQQREKEELDYGADLAKYQREKRLLILGDSVQAYHTFRRLRRDWEANTQVVGDPAAGPQAPSRVGHSLVVPALITTYLTMRRLGASNDVCQIIVQYVRAVWEPRAVVSAGSCYGRRQCFPAFVPRGFIDSPKFALMVPCSFLLIVENPNHGLVLFQKIQKAIREGSGSSSKIIVAYSVEKLRSFYDSKSLPNDEEPQLELAEREDSDSFSASYSCESSEESSANSEADMIEKFVDMFMDEGARYIQDYSSSNFHELCYKVLTRRRKIKGRPFNPDELSEVVVPLQMSQVAATTTFDCSHDAGQAARFKEMAQLEHASVASFSVFCLNLMACGAPLDLIREAHLAALDEIRHARVALNLASTFADGVVFTPAKMMHKFKITVSNSISELALSTAKEACCGETLSFLDMSGEILQESDLRITTSLRSIVEDEKRHCILGWKTVKWCIETNPAITDEILRIFERDERYCTLKPLTEWLFSKDGHLNVLKDQLDTLERDYCSL